MKFKFKYISTALLPLALAACVDDTLVNQGQEEWQQGDTPYYVNIRLRTLSDNFTRAGGDESDQPTFGNNQNGVHSGPTYMEHAISPNAGNFEVII